MKTWEKPRLIVLVRSKPEEAVLNGCKNEFDLAMSGPSTAVSKCMDMVQGVGCVGPCLEDVTT
jgi:hypothetical protein